MTTPSNEPDKTGTSIHLSYNRSGLGCLILIVGTPVALILFWKFVPTDVILRLELEYQLVRPARDTIIEAGPSAIPVLKDFISHQNSGKRMTAVRIAGVYIEYHPEESQPVVSLLCEKTLHDKKRVVQIYAIHALRNVRYPSDVIDKTILILLRSKDEDIRREAVGLLLSRISREIKISSSLCVAQDQLKPFLDRAKPDDCHTKSLKVFLEKCENGDEEK